MILIVPLQDYNQEPQLCSYLYYQFRSICHSLWKSGKHTS
uniref:Uncharacterized protein n=1 Tax=Myoviridae sp. ct3Sw5 TaxID=2826609 RepID=A0A8S5MNZ5_9CAUD|nr:MAG TPA: hypothetical protein [Myoviridae sp. ct3Sw5]